MLVPFQVGTSTTITSVLTTTFFLVGIANHGGEEVSK